MSKFAPAPIHTPMLDEQGLPSPVWAAYFTGLQAQLEADPLRGLAWTQYAPTITGGGSMVISGVTVYTAQYLQTGPLCFLSVYAAGVLSGTLSNYITITLPLGFALVGGTHMLAATVGLASSTVFSPGDAYIVTGGIGAGLVQVYPAGQTNYPAGNFGLTIAGVYRCG